jgi:hypothetical protein
MYDHRLALNLRRPILRCFSYENSELGSPLLSLPLETSVQHACSTQSLSYLGLTKGAQLPHASQNRIVRDYPVSIYTDALSIPSRPALGRPSGPGDVPRARGGQVESRLATGKALTTRVHRQISNRIRSNASLAMMRRQSSLGAVVAELLHKARCRDPLGDDQTQTWHELLADFLQVCS